MALKLQQMKEPMTRMLLKTKKKVKLPYLINAGVQKPVPIIELVTDADSNSCPNFFRFFKYVVLFYIIKPSNLLYKIESSRD